MEQLNINLVTAAIVLIMAMFIARGFVKRFSKDAMFFSIISTINSMLFFLSLAASLYVTKRIFFGEDDGSLYKWIYNILPSRVTSYLSDAGIVAYVIVSPLMLMLFFFILQYLRSLMDGILKSLSGWICTATEKGGGFLRIIAGVLIEGAKGVLVIVASSLIIGFLSIYYPGNIVADEANNSRLYNLVYDAAVSPIMESGFGQKIPVFFWSSVEEISNGIYNSKIINKSGTLQSMSLLRFQQESKSNDEIDKKAREIAGNEEDIEKKAYLLYRWIGTNIDYDWEKYKKIMNDTATDEKFGAINTFYARKGICEDYSNLFAAMARAVGLKVRVVVGQGYSGGAWGGHAWNEVYLPDDHKWIPLDTTWASYGNYFNNENFYDSHIFEAIVAEW